MLKNSAKSILAAFALVAGATFAAPASAEWPGNIELYQGGGGVGIHIGNGHIYKSQNHVKHRRLKHRKHHRPHYGNQVRHRGHCGPRRALNKAWRLGVNRPHIARLNKKRIVVVGYNYGHSAKVVFKRNSHRCKIIKTRGLYQ